MNKKEDYNRQTINSFDLDDYIETGSYSCDSDRVAKIIINSPVDTSFCLHVEQLKGSNESIQLLMQGCSGDIYYRVVSSKLTEWRRVITENALDEIIKEIRVELNQKANEEELRYLKNSLLDLLNSKADISFVKEIESRLFDLIFDKVTADNLTDLESKLMNLLENKADKNQILELENSIKSDSLSLKNEIIDIIDSKTASNNDKIKNDIKKSCLLYGDQGIPRDADLNDYNTIGNYYCEANVFTPTLKNKPADLIRAFTMKVILGNGLSYPSQLIIELYTGNQYYRCFDSYASTWGSWLKKSV